MKYFWGILFGIVAVSIAVFSMFGGARYASKMRQETMRVGGVQLTVDIAATPAERQQGLSGRDSLGAGRGMLFVFDDSGPWGFWMKDMRFSIDIIWVDADGRVVTVAPSVSPQSYPSVYTPTSPARYVLEVPAGFAKQNTIVAGANIHIPDTVRGAL